MKMLKTYLNVSAVLLATASLTLAQPPGGRGPDEGPDSNVDRMFNHDENEDGKLGKDEVPERLQGIFARADKDEDGFLNKEEVRAYFQSQAEGQGRGAESVVAPQVVDAAGSAARALWRECWVGMTRIKMES
jgi:hypothetical protein